MASDTARPPQRDGPQLNQLAFEIGFSARQAALMKPSKEHIRDRLCCHHQQEEHKDSPPAEQVRVTVWGLVLPQR